MDSIGVRELRQHASVYLDRVKKGESIQVTERGVPIAVLSPAPRGSLYERLVAEGAIVPAERDLNEWLKEHPPVDHPNPGSPTLSEILQQMRDEDDR